MYTASYWLVGGWYPNIEHRLLTLNFLWFSILKGFKDNQGCIDISWYKDQKTRSGAGVSNIHFLICFCVSPLLFRDDSSIWPAYFESLGGKKPPSQVGQVFKAKSEPKDVSATQATAMPVWLTFDGRRNWSCKNKKTDENQTFIETHCVEGHIEIFEIYKRSICVLLFNYLCSHHSMDFCCGIPESMCMCCVLRIGPSPLLPMFHYISDWRATPLQYILQSTGEWSYQRDFRV